MVLSPLSPDGQASRSPRGLPRGLRVLCLAGALAATAGSAGAQAQGEAALKVRITLSMTRFTQWPGGAGAGADSLRLCVAQRDPAIAQAFGEVDGQMVNGRRIQVTRAAPMAGCNVLFVHASADRPAELIRAGGGSGALVIGDAEGTLAHGGMVELVAVNDALRFDVNMVAVRQAQLALSSQVLKLARQVRE